MMCWYKDIQAILAEEPETWLAYLYGQQLENLPHLTRDKPKLRGAFLRLMGYFLFLIKNLKLWPAAGVSGPVDFFVFAGTANQIGALDGTVAALNDKDYNVLEVRPKGVVVSSDDKRPYVNFSLTTSDVLKSLFLLMRNGPSLYMRLKNKKSIATSWYLNEFLKVYTYLVYFHRALKFSRPKFVITSNDHIPASRSLLAVARHFSIKTVYMQHASVSALFPALCVDYAFLDGQCAWDAYKKCESNHPGLGINRSKPVVILSGQKKKLQTVSEHSDVIGLALNALDDIGMAVRFVNFLVNKGKEVCVRWHPGLNAHQVSLCIKSLSIGSGVRLSAPGVEPVADFLAGINWLVAGNSSIHLEAALVGVLPIYYEISPSGVSDYYGYVKNGLARKACDYNDVIKVVDAASSENSQNVEAIRYYSATYLTEWDGREGELVASHLIEAYSKE